MAQRITRAQTTARQSPGRGGRGRHLDDSQRLTRLSRTGSERAGPPRGPLSDSLCRGLDHVRVQRRPGGSLPASAGAHAARAVPISALRGDQRRSPRLVLGAGHALPRDRRPGATSRSRRHGGRSRVLDRLQDPWRRVLAHLSLLPRRHLRVYAPAAEPVVDGEANDRSRRSRPGRADRRPRQAVPDWSSRRIRTSVGMPSSPRRSRRSSSGSLPSPALLRSPFREVLPAGSVARASPRGAAWRGGRTPGR